MDAKLKNFLVQKSYQSTIVVCKCMIRHIINRVRLILSCILSSPIETHEATQVAYDISKDIELAYK